MMTPLKYMAIQTWLLATQSASQCEDCDVTEQIHWEDGEFYGYMEHFSGKETDSRSFRIIVLDEGFEFVLAKSWGCYDEKEIVLRCEIESLSHLKQLLATPL